MACLVLLAEVGLSRGAVVFFVTPVVTVAAAAAVPREAITAATLIGLVLIAVGSRLATRRTPGDVVRPERAGS